MVSKGEHRENVKERLTELLARRAPPRVLAGREEALDAEFEALLTGLAAVVPHDIATFWPIFDAELSQVSAYRTWPTGNELSKAAAKASAKMPRAKEDRHRDDKDRDIGLRWTASRMVSGQGVGEGYLYGREAVELISRGLVSEQTMTAYRTAAYNARVKVYGQEAADVWEAEAKARHEDARVIFKQRRTMVY